MRERTGAEAAGTDRAGPFRFTGTRVVDAARNGCCAWFETTTNEVCQLEKDYIFTLSDVKGPGKIFPARQWDRTEKEKKRLLPDTAGGRITA